MTQNKLNVLKVLSVLLILIQSIFSDISKYNYSINGTLNSTFHSNVSKTSTFSSSSGTFVWDAHLNGALSLKLSKNLINSNNLNLAYGQINIKATNSNSWSEPSINSNFIKFNSMLRYDNNQNNYTFVQLKCCSFFFDQTENLFFNPYTLSAASGSTFNYDADNLKISISGSTACSYAITKNKVKQTTDDTSTISINEFSIQSSRYISGIVELDMDLSYTVSEYLYLNSKILLSQPFASTDSLKKHFWNSTCLSIALTVNAPVTSYLNFCYSATLELNKSSKKIFQFDHSLSAGIFFNLKSPA